MGSESGGSVPSVLAAELPSGKGGSWRLGSLRQSWARGSSPAALGALVRTAGAAGWAFLAPPLGLQGHLLVLVAVPESLDLTGQVGGAGSRRRGVPVCGLGVLSGPPARLPPGPV